jgi:hypothetical protein
MLPGSTYPCGMGGRAEPPEGTPEGDSGGEEEFRSVVFDESFVRAARIQELSAQERMSAGTRPIRRRGMRSGGLPRQALALMLLVSLAFAAAVYMGTRHPYPEAATSSATLTMTVVPLEPGTEGIPTVGPSPSPTTSAGPTGTGSAAPGSPGGSAAASTAITPTSSPSPSASSAGSWPFAGTVPYDSYMMVVGKAGFQLPMPHHTADFSRDQVLHALAIVANYLNTSSLTPAVLTGGDTEAVRDWLAPGQYQQFDQSVTSPQDDQEHDATGWMVRFDPSKVRLASTDVLTGGAIGYQELNPDTLEVTSDHTFVYALTPVPAATTPSPSPSSSSSAGVGVAPKRAEQQEPIILFTVRRVLRYQFTLADLNANELEIVNSIVQAGPMACGSDASQYLQPVFPAPPAVPGAKGRAAAAPGATPAASPAPTAGTGVNPYDHHSPAWAVCGVLATGSTPA